MAAENVSDSSGGSVPPPPCGFCNSPSKAKQDPDKPRLTRYFCPTHGLIAASIKLGGIDWDLDISRPLTRDE